jgi:hypothetical protein
MADGRLHGIRPVGSRALDMARIEAGFIPTATDFVGARDPRSSITHAGARRRRPTGNPVAGRRSQLWRPAKTKGGPRKPNVKDLSALYMVNPPAAKRGCAIPGQGKASGAPVVR